MYLNPCSDALFRNKNGPSVTYYSSKSLNGNPLQLSCDDNTYAFGNSVIESPFMKVKEGHEKMIETVKLYNSTNKKQSLIDELLGILRCKKQYSDPQMKLQAPKYSSELLMMMSSRFCHVPSDNYGSRTHSVILVDNEDRVEFHEWTMPEFTPSSAIIPNDSNWIHSEYQFLLH